MIKGMGGEKMVNKLLSALITSFFICMLLAYMEYTPMNERSGDTYYFSYFSLVTIYLFYAVPITFFFGNSLFLFNRIYKWKIICTVKS